MNKITRIVIWICSKFNKADVVRIIQGLQQVLAERNPEIKFKDDFKKSIPPTGIITLIPYLRLLKNQPQRRLSLFWIGKNSSRLTNKEKAGP